MANLYSAWPNETDEDRKRSTNRLLRRLKIALVIWFVSFLITVIWFSYPLI